MGSCAVCGCETAAPNCAVCDSALSDAGTTPRRADDDPFRQRADEAYPQLKGAFSAWMHREHARYIGQSLTAIGIGAPMPREMEDGTFWSASVTSAAGVQTALYLGIDKNRDEVCIETPVVEIPEGFAAPILRASLELSGSLPHGIRLSARRERLVLRFVDAIGMVPPQRLLLLLRDLAMVARDIELVFRAQFPCRGLLNDVEVEMRRGGVTEVGRGKPIELVIPRRERP